MKNMNYKSIKEMPRVGFGLWKVPQDVCAKTVCKAIEIGYRHLDSASDYGNEKEVGEGIKAAIDQGSAKEKISGLHQNYGTLITIQIMLDPLSREH